MVLASSADEAEFGVLRAPYWTPRMPSTRPPSPATSRPASPPPDLVEVALDKIGVPAHEAVFIGDTVWDVQACQKARVPCIGLLSGGISRDELTTAGAAQVYTDPAELFAGLSGSLLGCPAKKTL